MKDSKNVVIGLLCAVICIMAVAYAAFSTTLTINGNATISSEWNVAISNISCEVHAVEGGIASEVTKSFNGTTAQFNIKFNQPGDTAQCVVTISNAGTLAAEVDSITTVVTDAKGSTTTLDSDAIRYSVSGIAKGTQLTSKGTNTYIINAEFYDANNGAAPAEAQLSKTLTVTIGYVQDLSA